MEKVILKLGEKEFELRATLGAFERFEEISGKNPFSQEDMKSLNAKSMGDLLHCLIKKTPDAPSREELSDMIDIRSMKEVSAAISKLMGTDKKE